VLNTADRKKRGYGEDSIYFDHASACRDGEHHRAGAGLPGSVEAAHVGGCPLLL